MASTSAMSRAEYLKKYMSGGGDHSSAKKKKKSKKTKTSSSGMMIVEEDAFKMITSQAKPDMDSDMEEELKIEAEIKRKVDSTKAKFRSAFTTVEGPVIKKEEPDSRSASPSTFTETTTRPRQRRDSDTSPPRRQRRDSDASPVRRRKRRDSDSSPPRRTDASRRGEVQRDSSPPRRKRRDSDSSPARVASSRARHDSDASPPRRQRKDSDEPTKTTRDSSPLRKRQRRDSDESPPRRRREDLAGRRGRGDSDESPPRRRRDDQGDLSPPRRKRGPSPGTKHTPVSPKRIKEEPVEEEEEGVTRTLDGKRAGLQSAADLRDETRMMKEREIEMFTNLASTISGRDAATIERQKMVGRNRDKPEDKEKKEREAKKQAELQDKYQMWNKGVVQRETRTAQLEEMARVAAEPFTRKADNEAMNEHLKSVIDEKEDPMAKVILTKKQKIDISKGRIVYPRYEGGWPPNRFGIPPGYRWDGVVRGNGFEGKLALTANEKRANEAEYYQNIQLYE